MSEREVTIVDETFLLRVAGIMGDSSAAAKALANRDRRRAAGEDAVVLLDIRSDTLLVGPRPVTA